MRSILNLACCAIAAATAGCSIHPIPDDVTRDSTTSIVRAIRCETRSAIRIQLAAILQQSPWARTREVGHELETGQRDLDRIYLKDIDRSSQREMKRFYDVGIGYNFELTMEENNDGVGDATFTLPFTNGTFTLGIAAGKEKRRENKRIFTIIDTVKELSESTFCLNAGVRDENWIYPITGEIGMAEFVTTFYQLVTASHGKLEQSEKTDAFSDQLTFRTRFFGTTNPKIVLLPVSNHFRLTQASATLGADRVDTHRLIIAIKLPDKFQNEVQLKSDIGQQIYNLRQLDAFRGREF